MKSKKAKIHSDLINVKSGELIVRIYKSGRTAIGIYGCEYNLPVIMHLGLTFDQDGGMHQFEDYGIGDIDEYRYRQPTPKEIIEIKKLMCGVNNQKYLDHILKYVNKMRKQKIKKLEQIKK